MIRALHYEPADGRPDTVVGSGLGLDVGSLLSGLVVSVGFNLIVPLSIVGVGLALNVASESITDEEQERLLEEEDIIEARFVTLGRDFEEELPNREVPLLDTAPRQAAEVPTDQTPVEARDPEEEQEIPPDAVEDELIRDVLNRSQVFAEIAEEREREGSPDGIEEGTEREGTEGDIYRGRLYSFFRRGWTVPTTIPQEEKEQLQAVVNIQIGQDLGIVSFEIARESDNPLFDQSIIEQLTRLQAGDQHIPPPPEDQADQFIGSRIQVRFHGRQAR